MDNRSVYFATGAAIALFTFLVLTKEGKLHELVPGQRIRGNDAHGSGSFGTGRGDKTHNGIDIVVSPGQSIHMPFTGKVVRIARPYADDLSWEGLAIQNERYFAKIYYLRPLDVVGLTLNAGTVIGHAQDIGKRYRGITPHVHLEIWDRSKKNTAIDPTNLF